MSGCALAIELFCQMMAGNARDTQNKYTLALILNWIPLMLTVELNIDHERLEGVSMRILNEITTFSKQEFFCKQKTQLNSVLLRFPTRF